MSAVLVIAVVRPMLQAVGHLYQSAQAMGTLKDPLGGGQQPATLFSSAHVRGDVAVQVGVEMGGEMGVVYVWEGFYFLHRL